MEYCSPQSPQCFLEPFWARCAPNALLELVGRVCCKREYHRRNRKRMYQKGMYHIRIYRKRMYHKRVYQQSECITQDS